MIGVHPIHRRLAELYIHAIQLGGYVNLSSEEMKEFYQIMQLNYNLIYSLDSLKNLSFLAYEKEDTDWHLEICRKIDELETKLI